MRFPFCGAPNVDLKMAHFVQSNPLDEGEMTMLIQISKRCLLVLLSLVSATTLYAQNATGSIHGTVTDEHNAVVINARVKVTNRATGSGRTVTTNSDGAY